MKYPQVAILIPCHNEQEHILETIKKSEFYGTVIVIDNASTDNSYTIASSSGAHVIKESRLGYGAAVMTGILEAKRLGKCTGIILNADHSDNPADIPILVEPVLHEGVDLCLSSRTRAEDQINLKRDQRFGNHLAVLLMRLKTGYHYKDMSPFRAFNIDSILSIKMEDELSGWNIEMQIKAVQCSLSIREVELPYRKHLQGSSKFSETLRNSINVGVTIIRTVFQH